MRTGCNSVISILAVGIIAAGIYTCQKNVAGTEITNGNCMGTIYNSDRSSAGGAVVYIVQADLIRTVQGTAIDSTVTDKAGQYSFNVTKSDIYNIIAVKGNAACLMDSISVKSDEKTVADGILAESGSLAGVIRVKEEDDPCSVIILVRGTGIYESPSDSTGAFEIKLLPEGTFSVQILFTGENQYAVVDTVVEIKKGVTTILDLVLPSNDAPTVREVTMSYDSSLMYATISWQPVDTAEIVSYALYRKSRMGKDTMVRVEKSAGSYVDDIVLLEDDTIRYEIAAVGKSFKEGNRCSTANILVEHKMKIVNEVLMDLSNKCDPVWFTVTETGYFIIAMRFVGSGMSDSLVFKKIDAKGEVVKSISFKFASVPNDYNIDNKGNILFLVDDSTDSKDVLHCTINKIDQDLNIAGKMSFETDRRIRSSVVFENGMFYLFADTMHCIGKCSGDGMTENIVMVYDADLNYIKTINVTFPYIMSFTCPFGELFLKGRLTSLDTKPIIEIDFWNSDCKITKTLEYTELIEKYIPESFKLSFSYNLPVVTQPGRLLANHLLLYEKKTIFRHITILGNAETPLQIRKFDKHSTRPEVYQINPCSDYAGNFYEMIIIGDESAAGRHGKIIKYSGVVIK